MIRIFLLLLLFPFAVQASIVPRRLIGFWDVDVDKFIEESNLHRLIEMPLNYLGIDIEYHEIHDPLPDLSNRPDVRGIILAFDAGTKMADPTGFLRWAEQAVDQGKKLILMEYPGFIISAQGDYTSATELNSLYEKLGFSISDEGVEYAYDYKVKNQDATFLPFERTLPDPLYSFTIANASEGIGQSLLSVWIPEKPATVSDLIIISSKGAYVAPNYAFKDDDSHPLSAGWYLNPFTFFEKALDLASLPVLDTTTLAGRRIFYSFCDGDAWNITTSIDEYRKHEMTCTEVMLEEVVKPNPDIPMTIGPIAADIDPNWVGTQQSVEILKKYAALPHVTIASHTYSHPFDWEFFRENPNEKEVYFLYKYTFGGWQNSFLSWYWAKYYEFHNPEEAKKLKLKWGYVTPRAYANHPFDIHEEITGAVHFIDQFIPPEKAVKMVLWSGDGRPWDIPVKLCYEAHLKNFGGGSVRLDASYPSYLFVGPLGRKPGGWIQIFSSASAEIIYTNNWTENFYAFRYLPETLSHLESPKRVKPLTLYYHSYSGQFRSSLNAVLSNLAYIKKQNSISITNDRYFDIGVGFYSAELESVGTNQWKIKNRKGLQTLRFDHPGEMKPDLSGSQGVIGFTEHEGSLYVYLDAGVEEPLVQMGNGKDTSTYLKESSWEIWDLNRTGGLTFKAKGWGKLVMKWSLPGGTYTVHATGPDQFLHQWDIASDGNEWKAELELPQDQEIRLEVKSKSS